jgi:hypothetical protein
MDNGNDDRDHEAIRQRAFELWEAEGRPEGKHEEHWHRATQEKRENQARGEVPGLQPFETMTNQDSTD